MRLLAFAIAIVIAFGLGAWVISRLLPETVPEWVGLTLSIMWLFLLIFGVTLTSNKSHRKIEDQRRLLGSGLLAAVLMAFFLVPLFVYRVSFPKWAAEAVLAAIAGAVFLLSKCLERRKLERITR
jgi:antibiotic biosynthesis monooxygenase (ABM) superfamily enzyme